MTAVDLHRRNGVLLMRHVLRRVKPAVRIREEQELQPCHGVDQHACAGNPDLGLVVARAVLTFVVRLLLLLGVETRFLLFILPGLLELSLSNTTRARCTGKLPA